MLQFVLPRPLGAFNPVLVSCSWDGWNRWETRRSIVRCKSCEHHPWSLSVDHWAGPRLGTHGWKISEQCNFPIRCNTGDGSRHLPFSTRSTRHWPWIGDRICRGNLHDGRSHLPRWGWHWTTDCTRRCWKYRCVFTDGWYRRSFRDVGRFQPDTHHHWSGENRSPIRPACRLVILCYRHSDAPP